MKANGPELANQQSVGAVAKSAESGTDLTATGTATLPVGEDDADALNAEFDLDFVISGR